MSKLPTGVEIRGRYIRIWFMFRGKRCRGTFTNYYSECF
ncbi:Arm DNA-binding domain-containing protein [Escherichia coli]